MKLKKLLNKRLYLFTFPNQFETCSTFFRLQEFYESPIKSVRNKYNSLEDLIRKDAYDNKEDGQPVFNYYTAWAGFNVPGNIVQEFYIQCRYGMRFLNSEEKLFDKLDLTLGDNFYVIGCEAKDTDVIKHEIAHAMYYLIPEYKKEIDKLIKKTPKRMKVRIFNWLLKNGYCKAVLKDELQAYCSTGLRSSTLNIFQKVLYASSVNKYKKIFDKYYKENIKL